MLEPLILPFLSDAVPPSPLTWLPQPSFHHHGPTAPDIQDRSRVQSKETPPSHSHRVVDYSSAFDTVSHTNLLTMSEGCPLHHNLIRWLNSYLCGRFATCQYGTVTSPLSPDIGRRPSRFSHLPHAVQLLCQRFPP